MLPPGIDGKERATLVARPLTSDAFAAFGDVIERQPEPVAINQGKGFRSLDLATLDLDDHGGQPAISLVACIAETLPVPLRLMERHPSSTQAFMPIDGQYYLVVVAPAGLPPKMQDLHAFLAHGQQGINYHRGVWHHPMIALDAACTFLEVHRAGPGINCDEHPLADPAVVVLDPALTCMPGGIS